MDCIPQLVVYKHQADQLVNAKRQGRVSPLPILRERRTYTRHFYASEERQESYLHCLGQDKSVELLVNNMHTFTHTFVHIDIHTYIYIYTYMIHIHSNVRIYIQLRKMMQKTESGLLHALPVGEWPILRISLLLPHQSIVYGIHRGL